MLTRRNFLATGAGALAASAFGGAAFAATADAGAAPALTIISESFKGSLAGDTAQLVLGTDRLANLSTLRATIGTAGAAPVALHLDAADAMLFEIAAADLGRNAWAATAIRPSTLSAGA